MRVVVSCSSRPSTVLPFCHQVRHANSLGSAGGAATRCLLLGNTSIQLEKLQNVYERRPAHLRRQNLLFNYFYATLGAEIRAAKAEGRYFEGMSELAGSPTLKQVRPCEASAQSVQVHANRTSVPAIRECISRAARRWAGETTKTFKIQGIGHENDPETSLRRMWLC